MSTRLFWLSFADKPPTGFLGGCVVEVTTEDIKTAVNHVGKLFPHALPGAEFVAAAVTVATRLGCNPGGSVMCSEFPEDAEAAKWPRGVLLSKADIALLEAAVGEAN